MDNKKILRIIKQDRLSWPHQKHDVIYCDYFMLNHFVHIIIKYFSNQFEYVNVLFINKQIGLCSIQFRC